jgi:hypothetical protein
LCLSSSFFSSSSFPSNITVKTIQINFFLSSYIYARDTPESQSNQKPFRKFQIYTTCPSTLDKNIISVSFFFFFLFIFLVPI